jgi:hypothetical protein
MPFLGMRFGGVLSPIDASITNIFRHAVRRLSAGDATHGKPSAQFHSGTVTIRRTGREVPGRVSCPTSRKSCLQSSRVTLLLRRSYFRWFTRSCANSLPRSSLRRSPVRSCRRRPWCMKRTCGWPAVSRPNSGTVGGTFCRGRRGDAANHAQSRPRQETAETRRRLPPHRF